MMSPESRSEAATIFQRKQAAFVILNEDFTMAAAEPNALSLLEEIAGSPVDLEQSSEALRPLKDLWESRAGSSEMVMIGSLIVRMRAVTGKHRFVVLAIERRAQREYIKGFIDRYGISPRESEVLVLILRGLSSRQIASELSISATTVRDHFRNMLRKTDSLNRSEMLSKFMP